MNLEEKLKAFCLAREFQPHTVDTYLSQLRIFLTWCNEHGLSPEQAKTEHLLKFMSEGKSASSKSQRRAVLANLYESILGQGFKTIPLPYPKKHIRLPNSLTPQDVMKLISCVRNHKQRLILQTMYALGLRVSEVVRIKRKHLYKRMDLADKTEYYELLVVGKGNKERRIAVPDQTALALLNHIRIKQIEKGFIFKGQFKAHYSETSVRKVFERAKHEAGITIAGSSHLLRKSRATHLINSQVNDRTIMQMFGWNQQKTIDYYHKASTATMRNVMNHLDEELLLLDYRVKELTA